MHGLRRKLMTAISIAAAALLAAAFCVIFFLTVPFKPVSGPSLAFDGYISLPRVKFRLVNVLDYLTINGGNLYVTSVSSGDLYRVFLPVGPLPKRIFVASLAGEPSAHGVAIDPVSKLGFVSRSGADTVDVFDTSAMKRVKRLKVDKDVDGVIYVPSEKLIYAINGDAKMATLIDPLKQKVIDKISLGGRPEFAVYDPVTKKIYQNLTDTNSLAVVSVPMRSVINRLSMPFCQGPSGIALDVAGRHLFIGCSKNSVLVIMNIDSLRVIFLTPIGGAPDVVAYDAGLKRIYSTGKLGVLSVIQQISPNVYRTTENLYMHFGAHTLAVDPITHKVYVGYASLFIAPRLAVLSPKF